LAVLPDSEVEAGAPHAVGSDVAELQRPFAKEIAIFFRVPAQDLSALLVAPQRVPHVVRGIEVPGQPPLLVVDDEVLRGLSVLAPALEEELVRGQLGIEFDDILVEARLFLHPGRQTTGIRPLRRDVH
jgi:hypothetical protein